MRKGRQGEDSCQCLGEVAVSLAKVVPVKGCGRWSEGHGEGYMIE